MSSEFGSQELGEKKTVVLRADRSVPYGKIVLFLDCAKSLQFTQIGFAVMRR